MKKISKEIGIIAIAVIIGISFAACDNGTKKDALDGTTWEATYEGVNIVLTFNSPAYITIQTYQGVTNSVSGTYTILENTVVFTTGYGSETGVLSGNTLPFVDGPTFTKK